VELSKGSITIKDIQKNVHLHVCQCVLCPQVYDFICMFVCVFVFVFMCVCVCVYVFLYSEQFPSATVWSRKCVKANEKHLCHLRSSDSADPKRLSATPTYYAGQGCVLQRWDPSVGLVRGLHMVELTWTFWSCRQIALVEIRPDGKLENKEGERKIEVVVALSGDLTSSVTFSNRRRSRSLG